MSDTIHSALFICLGNICRSPIAEKVFKHIVEKNGLSKNWKISSAGLGSWHVGNPADPRAEDTLSKHKIDPTHRAKQIKKSDFNEYDYIFGMDEDNMRQLRKLAPPDSKAKLFLLGEFDPEGDKIIRDPYYDSDTAGFEKCYQQCYRSCEAFLKKHKDG